MRKLLTAWAPLHRRRLLAAWCAVAIAELIMVSGDIVRPDLRETVLEVGFLSALGIVHARFAPDDYRASSLIPAVALVALTIGHLELWDVSERQWLLGSVGLACISFWAVRIFAAPFFRGLPTIVIFVTCIFLARWLAVGSERPEALGYPLDARLPLSSQSEGPPIVIITVDTLRSDEAIRMKSYLRLAERGVSWPRAMSASSWTIPSLVTLFTGVRSEVHGAGNSRAGFSGVAPNVPLLAEELRAIGYTTAAFVTNAFVDEAGFGLRRGFQTWRYAAPSTVQPLMFSAWPRGSRKQVDARHVVNGALSFLKRAPQRGVFLWVHLLEPHLPYMHGPPESRFGISFFHRARVGRVWSPPLRALRDAYRREVEHADQQLMRLLDALEERGYFKDAVIVFSSDHGEEFWEHGGFEHGHSHHGEVLDVPLALIAPGMGARPGEGVASIADVAPTVRAIVGLEPRGIDLRQTIAGDRVASAAGNLYGGYARSLRKWNTRIIIDTKGTKAYDLQADPQELRPRLLREDELSAYEPARSTPTNVQTPVIDVNVQGLRALGYIQ